MASCDVQATRSQDELKKTENTKNVKNSEDLGALNFKSSVEMDAEPTASSESDLRPSRSSVTKMTTKIPAPIFLGPSGSLHQISSRRLYSSVVRNSVDDHQMTDDSGIQLESSMTELADTTLTVRPSPILQTILDRIPGTSSEMELRRAEEQTLKELQRVVAEMEAEVALDDLDMQDVQFETEESRPNEDQGIENKTENSGLNVGQLSVNKTQQKLPDDPEKVLSNEELPVVNQQAKQEKCADIEEQMEDPEKVLSNEELPVADIEEQMDKEVELFEKLAEEPAEESTQMVLQEPIEEPQKSVPETLMEELEMAISGGGETAEDRFLRNQFERSPETMGLKFQQPTDENQSNISDSGLTARPSVDGSVESDRRMVPLEELFDPEHNVELLRQLLQSGAEENTTTEAEPVVNETEMVEDIEAEVEMEAEPEAETEIEEEMDSGKKQTASKSFSFFRRLIGRKLLQLSYPILFCSLAFSLIYLSRKE
ncbi:ring-infected erythrocyte surface antigen [Drosophila takahashii]|uniref:ring-infected erythrocyte surface antigen n=1 Tax=Drosophila takahashii TaxID=29030 RepID=UPI001CF86652|nr:uncharacterized protein LOC108069215 [Drosophila takahashii]XP_017014702.2 uncharacterized protein LOC108069215 [Drosophila takahashii]